jgi:hypothetical protein
MAPGTPIAPVIENGALFHSPSEHSYMSSASEVGNTTTLDATTNRALTGDFLSIISSNSQPIHINESEKISMLINSSSTTLALSPRQHHIQNRTQFPFPLFGFIPQKHSLPDFNDWAVNILATQSLGFAQRLQMSAFHCALKLVLAADDHVQQFQQAFNCLPNAHTLGKLQEFYAKVLSENFQNLLDPPPADYPNLAGTGDRPSGWLTSTQVVLYFRRKGVELEELPYFPKAPHNGTAWDGRNRFDQSTALRSTPTSSLVNGPAGTPINKSSLITRRCNRIILRLIVADTSSRDP